MTAEPPFAFISYPREVAEVAAKLHTYLEERMVPTWYDYQTVAGEHFPKVLSQRLSECEALILLVAPGIDDPKWLLREIGIVRNNGKRIFSLLLPGAGEAELKQLGVAWRQASRLEGDAPPDEWVRAVHDQLYRPPASTSTEASPGNRTDRRRPAIAAAVAGAVGLALGGLGGWYAHSPAAGAGHAAGRCAGRAAHIDTVSTESPGHTGYTPQITVTVCTAAAPGHSYWLMDYTVGGDGRRFYAKAKVDGALGSRAYRVVHDKSTGVATARTYLVLDVPPELDEEVTQHWTTPDGAPVVTPGTDLPPGVTRISDEAPAVL